MNVGDGSSGEVGCKALGWKMFCWQIMNWRLDWLEGNKTKWTGGDRTDDGR